MKAVSFGHKYMFIPDRSGAISAYRKKVYVYSLTGELLETYPSVKEASEKTRIRRGDISKSVRKNQVLKGKIFSYDFPYVERPSMEHLFTMDSWK